MKKIKTEVKNNEIKSVTVKSTHSYSGKYADVDNANKEALSKYLGRIFDKSEGGNDEND